MATRLRSFPITDFSPPIVLNSSGQPKTVLSKSRTFFLSHGSPSLMFKVISLPTYGRLPTRESEE